MDDQAKPRTPSAEELKEADVQLKEFLAKIKAVPESERHQVDSDKFMGPVGTRIIRRDPDGDSPTEGDSD